MIGLYEVPRKQNPALQITYFRYESKHKVAILFVHKSLIMRNSVRLDATLSAKFTDRTGYGVCNAVFVKRNLWKTISALKQTKKLSGD